MYTLYIVFSALYALDGLLRERMFSLVGYGATIIIIMLYVIANYGIKSERKQLTDPLRLVYRRIYYISISIALV